MKRSEDNAGAKPLADAGPSSDVVATPLRKRRLSGELYERDPKVNALIAELALLPRDGLVARAAITKRSEKAYIPSECLIYFIRASRRDNNEA
jgi:hypothetical protein